MDLDSRAWATLEGGHQMPYNASRPLKKLRDATTPSEFHEQLNELWDNLHHNGAVGPASYLAVPHLVSIGIDKRSLDPRLIGLIVVIEHARLSSADPSLPQDYDDIYFGSLLKLESYLHTNFKNITDRDTLRLSLALFATINGQPALGRIIEYLNESALETFTWPGGT